MTTLVAMLNISRLIDNESVDPEHQPGVDPNHVPGANPTPEVHERLMLAWSRVNVDLPFGDRTIVVELMTGMFAYTTKVQVYSLAQVNWRWKYYHSIFFSAENKYIRIGDEILAGKNLAKRRCLGFHSYKESSHRSRVYMVSDGIHVGKMGKAAISTLKLGQIWLHGDLEHIVVSSRNAFHQLTQKVPNSVKVDNSRWLSYPLIPGVYVTNDSTQSVRGGRVITVGSAVREGSVYALPGLDPAGAVPIAAGDTNLYTVISSLYQGATRVSKQTWVIYIDDDRSSAMMVEFLLAHVAWTMGRTTEEVRVISFMIYMG
jgi:hypothetical protein